MKRIIFLSKYIILLLMCLFLISCDSESNCPEKEIEFRVNNNILEWRYTDGEWKTVYDLSELNKEPESDKNPELNEDLELIIEIVNNKLVYSYSNGEVKELIDLDSLKGENGTNGEDGKNVEFELVDNKLICGYPGEDKTLLIDFDNIFDSKYEIEFLFEDLILKWRYTYENEWKELFNFSNILDFKNQINFEVVNNQLIYKFGDDENVLIDLTRLKGEDGREIEFELEGNKLMFGYEGDTKTLLFDFDSIIQDDSKILEFTVDNFVLMWRYANDTEWEQLVDLKQLFEEVNSDLTDIVIIDKVQSVFNSVIEDCSKSVVGVANYQNNASNKLVKASVGTGFVYKVKGILSDGLVTDNLEERDIVKYKHYIITNRHVVEDSNALKIYLSDDRMEYDATLVRFDTKDDLAIIVFNHDEYIKPLKLGDSTKVKSGDFVIAIGNPEGFEFSNSATMGIVSHPNRYISVDTNNDDVNDWDLLCIQHDCAINPGNSGGPLFNIYGEVIGVNTLKFATTDIDNMGFSITIDVVKNTISYLEKGEIPPRIVLGITIQSISSILSSGKITGYLLPESITEGIYITEVATDSLASSVLLKDDIILEFNGVKMRELSDLRIELNKFTPNSGEKINILIFRDGFKKDVVLTIN